MRKLFGKAIKGAGNLAGKGVSKAAKTVKDPKVRQQATGLAKTVASVVSAEQARKACEATIGKDNTEKAIKTGQGAFTKADKALGEGRLDAAFTAGKSAALTVPVAGKLLPAAIVASAAVGFATKRDPVGDAAKALFGTDKPSETEDTPKTPEATTPPPTAQVPAGDKKPKKGPKPTPPK